MRAARISIGGIVKRAFGFTFGDWVRAFVVSLPMLILLVLIQAAMVLNAPEISRPMVEDIPQLGAAFTLHTLQYGFIGLIPLLIWTVGLYRVYFDSRAWTPYVPGFVAPLGVSVMPALKFLWANVVALFIVLVLGVVLFVIGLALYAAVFAIGSSVFGETIMDAWRGQASGTFTAVLWAGIALGVGIGLYLAVTVLIRLSVLPPSVIRENRVSIRDTWGLTKGHVLSLVGAYILGLLAFMIPLVAVLGVVMLALSAAGLENFVWLMDLAQGNVPQAMPDITPLTALVASIVVYVFGFFSQMFAVGLSGAAYEAVGGELGGARADA